MKQGSGGGRCAGTKHRDILGRLMDNLCGRETRCPVGPENEFAPTGLPSHPVIEIVMGADWWGKLQRFFVAAVVAPIVEETMFRGVLDRQLREASARWAFFASFLFAATVNSFIFAVIDPQGYVAVPALMGNRPDPRPRMAWFVDSWHGCAHGVHGGLLMTMVC